MTALRKRFFPPLLVAVTAMALGLGAFFACTGEGKAKDKPHYTFKEGQGPAGAMVSIDGKVINEDELMGNEKLEFIDAMKKIYDLRMDRVGRLLLEKTYEADAKKANQSVEEYVETKVLKGGGAVSSGDYEKFVKEKKIPKEQLNPQLKERIEAYMKAQKRQEELQNLIVKLSKQHKVEIFFQKPMLKMNIDVGQAPTYGDPAAKVKIVEFSDFQCPYCAKAAETVTQLRKMYGKKIQLAFKNYPLPFHQQAKPASEASMCVNEQGSEKYWKYHDKLFANNDKLDAESLKKFAKDVGANVDQFAKCFDEKKYAKTVQDDIEYGNKLGVRSTPTFFINGKLVSGAQPIENFKEIIDEELSSGT